MKKSFLFIAVFFISTAGFSQTGIQYGLKAGGTLPFAKVTVDGLSQNGSSPISLYAGGFIELSPSRPTNKLKIQLEALYANYNFKYNWNGSVDKVDIQQINVPLLAEYFIIPSLSLEAGPTFNFNVAGKKTVTNDASQFDEVTFNSKNYRPIQLGAAVGASYYLFKKFFFDARYDPLFGSWNRSGSDEGGVGATYKISTATLGVGYKF